MISLDRLDEYVTPPGASIGEVLIRLNATEHLFQLVIDGEGRLIGTVTDGDVRRALLRGATMDDPIKDCMHRDFLAKRAGARDEAANASPASGRTVPFVPLLDTGGRVLRVIIPSAEPAERVRALIMAGGFGRRLGERTRETPKPLLPVGGRPILDHVIEGLEADGVDTVFVAVHYRADQIRAFLAGRPSKARIQVLEETEPLGTAGALGLLPDSGAGPVLVVNGDVITRASFSALRDFHARHGLDATVGVTRYDIDVPFGVIRFGEDGLFAGIDEKPRVSNFVAAGVYYLTPEFTALVPGRGAIDMPELLNLGRTLGLRIGLFPIHEYWTDVGRPADLDAADRVARENGDAGP